MTETEFKQAIMDAYNQGYRDAELDCTTCLDCNTSLEICTCMDDTIDMKEEPKFKNRQIGAAGFVANKIMENAVSKFNQETLEEVANRILSKEGVKLHPSGLETYLKGNVINAMVEISKWQQERMYSEEEVEVIARDAYAMGRSNILIGGFNIWFEIKKK